ncbi:hypothetical protein [Kineosporia babensis]|uniref:Uncharacterized protein n=1 Tax=Kineosporia babensis TaxID=499548 RepID=A0A9X1N978_9ACTN|nr:hypothetical protein [Kineosporia babensis]MCD5310862.1 hypothetical protein [Kineosporia babensis]
MRIYAGTALIAAVVYVAGLLLPPDTGAAVTGIAAIFFLFSVAMIGVELIRSWQEDRREW